MGLLKRIQFLPVDHQTKMRTAQLMATSKAAYGWVGKAPPAAAVASFNKAIRHCSKAFRSGSSHLQLMLNGAHLALDAVVGRRQILLWCKRLSSERWNQHTQATSHLAKAAQAFLSQHGWQQQGHQQWKHRRLGISFRCSDVLTDTGYHRIAHHIRESWREQQWILFRSGQRRDAQPFKHTPYDSKRFGLTRKIVQQSTGATLAILIGSVVSPAAFAKRKNTPAQYTQCPQCNASMADQHHLYWTCPNRYTRRAPRDALEARFGSPQSANDTSTLAQLTETVERLWEQRHRESAFGRPYKPKGFTCRVKP